MSKPMLNHAMILAAGLGTRLRPQTDHCPKALVEVAGVPVLERLILRLRSAGLTSITVNVHHLADQVEDFLRKKKNFGLKITISDERDALLDSGGGIGKASAFFPAGEPVLVHNADVISDLDIGKMASFFHTSAALALLAVRRRDTQRYYLFDADDRLAGWKNLANGRQLLVEGGKGKNLNPLAFSGISILSPEFTGAMRKEGVFPLRDELLRQAGRSTILAYRHDKDYWIDVGRPEQLREAAKRIAEEPQ